MSVLLVRAGVAVADQGDVARGAAHVEGQRQPRVLLGRQPGRADHAAGGAAQDGPGGVLGGVRDRQHAAARLHDRRSRQARVGRPPGQPAQVAAQQRRQVRVHGGRREALVLPDLGQHLARRAHVDAGQRLPQRRGHLRLVLRVGEREQQPHAPRPRPGRPAPPRPPARGRRVRTARRTPSGPHRSAHLVDALVGHQGRRVVDVQAVEVGAGLAAQLQHVAEPLGGDQARCGRPCPPAGRWCRRSSRGAKRATSAGARPARSSAASTAATTPSLWSSGVVGTLAVTRRPPCDDRRVGEGAAHVDAHQGAFRWRWRPRLSSRRDPTPRRPPPVAARRDRPSPRPPPPSAAARPAAARRPLRRTRAVAGPAQRRPGGRARRVGRAGRRAAGAAARRPRGAVRGDVDARVAAGHGPRRRPGAAPGAARAPAAAALSLVRARPEAGGPEIPLGTLEPGARRRPLAVPSAAGAGGTGRAGRARPGPGARHVPGGPPRGAPGGPAPGLDGRPRPAGRGRAPAAGAPCG